MANYYVTRLVAGTVGSYQLRSDTSAVIADWTRQADMASGVSWGDVVVSGEVVNGEYVQALDGSEGVEGFYHGEIEWFVLTEDMRQYLKTNIFGSEPNALVTMEVYHQELGYTVFNCRLRNPFGRSIDGRATHQTVDLYSNTKFEWFRGTEADYGRAYSSGYSSGYS